MLPFFFFRQKSAFAADQVSREGKGKRKVPLERKPGGGVPLQRGGRHTQVSERVVGF